MELTYTDKNFKEKGYLRDVTIDIVLGQYGKQENDFELTISSINRDSSFDEGSLFYWEGTEFGGMVENKKVDTSKNSLTFKGSTFRGMLEKEYIQPPTGSAYLVLKGEANTIIQQLIGNKFGDLFVVDDIGSSGITIDYQVRDLNLLEGIEKMLGKVNARLEISIKKDGKVHLKAVPIQDLSGSLQYDNSYQVHMLVETAKKPYNHVLALGKGELTERLRVNLYLQQDGTWGDNEYYTGLQRKTYKHEDTNIEDIEELKEKAVEKVKEVNGTETLSVSFSSDDASLFDIVAAKEEITGISFKQPITQKILKGTIFREDKNIKIEYKVGE